MKITNKKAEIQEKAIQLFNEKGFDQVTLNDICAAASISKNTFYYYFDSKDSLLNDKLCKPPLTQEDFAQIILIDSSYEQYCALMRKHIDHLNQCGKEIMKKSILSHLSDSIDADSFLGKNHKENHQYIFQLQQQILAKAQKDGEILNHEDPAILVRGAACMLIGLTQIWITDIEDKLDLGDAYFKLLDTFLQKKKD